MRVSVWSALLRYSKSSRTVKHSFLPARISPFRCEEESAEAEHNAAVLADRVQRRRPAHKRFLKLPAALRAQKVEMGPQLRPLHPLDQRARWSASGW